MKSWFDRLFKIHAVQRFHHSINKLVVTLDGKAIDAEKVTVNWELPAYEVLDRLSIVKPVITVVIETGRGEVEIDRDTILCPACKNNQSGFGICACCKGKGYITLKNGQVVR